jgi:ribosome production factor 1
VEYANNREFTSVMVVHTNRREPGRNSSISFSFLMFLFVTSYSCICVTDALLIINLPEGPTAHFKLSKLVLRKDIKVLYSVPFIIVFYVFSNFFHVK